MARWTHFKMKLGYKHGQCYVVSEIQFFGGSNFFHFFLVERWISQLLEALFHPVSKENPATFAPFVPKFQNPISHDSLCRSFFDLNVLVWWGTLDKRTDGQFSQKYFRLIDPKIMHPYIPWYCCIMKWYTK